MKAGLWGLGIVLAYALFLLVTAPASWAAYALAHASQGQVVLSSPKGSFWTGRGQLYWRGGQAPVHVGRLSWHVQGWELLAGAVRADLVLRGPIAAKLRVTRSLKTLTLSQLHVRTRGGALNPLSPEIQLLGFAGPVRLDIPRLVFSATQVTGQGRLDWDEAGLSISRVRPLGSYDLAMRGHGHQLHLELETRSGPLQVAGTGTWTVTGGAGFAGTMSVPDGNPRLLRLLQFVGTPAGVNERRFALQMSVPGWNQMF